MSSLGAAPLHAAADSVREPAGLSDWLLIILGDGEDWTFAAILKASGASNGGVRKALGSLEARGIISRRVETRPGQPRDLWRIGARVRSVA